MDPRERRIERMSRRTWGDPRRAQAYARHQALQPGEQALLAELGASVKGKAILDLGVGAGRTLPFLSELAGDYTGVDFSPAMVAAARTRHPQARLLQADVRDLSVFEDRRFDFAFFSYNGLDCLVQPDRLRALSELRRVLRPGGLLAFSSHNRDHQDFGTWTIPFPGLGRNPLYNARVALRWLLGELRHRRNRRLDLHETGYALVNDPTEEWAVMTYYIGFREQLEQLRQAGFEPLDHAYGVDGAGVSAPDSKNPWLYYAARRRA